MDVRPFNVPELLGRPLEVSLTKESGTASIIFLIHQHLGQLLPKDDARVQTVAAWLANEFDHDAKPAWNGKRSPR